MGAGSNGSTTGGIITDTEQLFTLSQLAELSGIDTRSLQNWVSRGLIVPSHQRANGSGTVHLFGPREAAQARILGELRRSGVELRALEKAADYLRRDPEDLDGGFLVITDEVQRVDGKDLNTELQNTGPALVYNLGHVADLA